MRLKENSFLYTIVYVIILLLAVAWLGSLVSCSPTRKNAKAFSRVLSDEKLFERMGQRWEEANPCIPGTITIGKDSIRIDTVFNNDFVFGEDSVRVDSFESVVIKTVIKKVPVYITKTIQRVDTVPDLRRIASKDAEINNLKGKLSATEETAKNERKRGNKWMYSLFGLLALIIASIFLKYRYANTTKT